MDNKGNSKSESTFGRGFMKYLAAHLPYQSYTVLDNIDQLNPNFKHFYGAGTRKQEIISQRSISSSLPDSKGMTPKGDIHLDQRYQQYMYAVVDNDKGKRLRDYRVMAAFAEVSNALDEICDDFINKDNEGNFITLKLDNNPEGIIEKDLQKDFKRVVQVFDFENKGWEYCRNLLVDGEIYFEHVIHPDHPDKGILGTINIPSEIIDPIYDSTQNMAVKGFLLKKAILSAKLNNNTNAQNVEKIELIPLDKNQVTYIQSGIWNEEHTMRLPFIETARRAYRQLSLIEDSILIYRMVRAPERLVFNVDVGNMPATEAETYVKKLMNTYWSKKTFDKEQTNGKFVQTFNPQSMLDNFWFPKRTGSEGTTVTALAGGSNLGELTDLMYFVKKLYSALKVPTNRVDPESTYQDGTTVLREELKFAKFIVRLQAQFATALKNTFITHLKLRGYWEKYKMKESYLKINFNPPSNFFELRNQQIFELKANNFNAMVANENISPSLALKEYMGWDDTKLIANREWLRKDNELKWELSQIQTNGPNWREAVASGTAQNVEGGDFARGGGSLNSGMGSGGGGMGTGGTEETPPEFGTSAAAPATKGAGPTVAPTQMPGGKSALPAAPAGTTTPEEK